MSIDAALTIPQRRRIAEQYKNHDCPRLENPNLFCFICFNYGRWQNFKAKQVMQGKGGGRKQQRTRRS